METEIRNMTEMGYIDELMTFLPTGNYTSSPEFRADMFSRPVHIAYTRANYGQISTVIIELQGSPPRLQLIYDLYYRRVLYFNGKALMAYSKRNDRLSTLVDNYLRTRLQPSTSP